MKHIIISFSPTLFAQLVRPPTKAFFEDAKRCKKDSVCLSDGVDIPASTPLYVNWALIQNCFYNEEDGSFIWLHPNTQKPFTPPYYCVETGETLDEGDFYFSKDYESYETLTLIANIDIYRGMNLDIPTDREIIYKPEL